MLGGLKKVLSQGNALNKAPSDDEKALFVEYNLREVSDLLGHNHNGVDATTNSAAGQGEGGKVADQQGWDLADKALFARHVNGKVVCSCLKEVDTHWRKDLVFDHLDILRHSIYPQTQSNTNPNPNPNGVGDDDKLRAKMRRKSLVPKMHYPHMANFEYGIIRLKHSSLKNNTLFNILSNTYKSRGDSGPTDPAAIEKYKITFVTVDGTATKSLHFHDEKDYWNLIHAVKASAAFNSHIEVVDNKSRRGGADDSFLSYHTKVFGGKIVSFAGNCLFPVSQTDSGGAGIGKYDVTKRSTLISSMLLNRNSTLSPNTASESLAPRLIEVHDYTLRVFDPSASQSSGDMFTLDINGVVAMFITSNSKTPKPFMLECSLLPDVDVINPSAGSGGKPASTVGGGDKAAADLGGGFGDDYFQLYEKDNLDYFEEESVSNLSNSSAGSNFLDKYSIKFSYNSNNFDQDSISRNSLDGSGDSKISKVSVANNDSNSIPTYSTNTTLMLPITEADVIERTKQVGIEDDNSLGRFNVSGLPFAVSLVTDASFSLNNAVNYFLSKVQSGMGAAATSSIGKQAEEVASNVIPFTVFLNDSYYTRDSASSENAATSSTRATEGKAVVKPDDFTLFRNPQIDTSTFLKTNDYLNSKILIQKKGLSRALRLVIHTASDLEVFDSKGDPKPDYLPSTYCTVYLVDADGNKLSNNTQDVRTNMCPKSRDPEWNREIYLQKSHKIAGDGKKLSSSSGSDDFLEGVAGVRIVLRDGASGFMGVKHDHLGQAMLPLHCFLYQQEAKFHLPIETSYRSNEGDGGPKGEIFLTTEMITVEAIPASSRTDIETVVDVSKPDEKKMSSFFSGLFGGDKKQELAKNSVDSDLSAIEGGNLPGNKLSSNITNLNIRRAKSDDAAIVTLRYCIYNIRTLNTFWPFRSLIATDNGVGHIFFGQSFIFLKLLPGVGGLLSNCLEYNELTKSVVIPYSQLKSCNDLTTSVAFLSISINSCTSNPTQKAKGELIYSLVEMPMLVAPCPAADVQAICIDRRKIMKLREHFLRVKTLIDGDTFHYFPQLSMVNSELSTKGPRRGSIALITSYYDNLCASAMQLNSDGSGDKDSGVGNRLSRNRRRSSSNANQFNSQAFVSSKRHLSRSRVLWKMIENTINECHEEILKIDLALERMQKIVRSWLLLSDHDDFVHYMIDDLRAEKKMWQRVLIRCFIYTGDLIQSIKILRYLSIDFLSFSVDEVVGLTNTDRSDSLIITPLRKEANPWSLVDRHNYIYQVACCRLRDHLLSSSDFWGDFSSSYFTFTSSSSSSSPPQLASTSAAPLSPQKDNSKGAGKGLIGLLSPSSPSSSSTSSSIANFFPVPAENVVAICVSELLSSYNNTLKMSLFPYISSRDAFSKISGQELKIVLVQLVLTTNMRLNQSIRSILRPLGLHIEPAVVVMPERTVQDVLDWYAAILQAEVNSWLDKTMQQALKNRTNKFNFPFDLEKAGTFLISTIPETLRYQLNVVLDLCTKPPDMAHQGNGDSTSVSVKGDILQKLTNVRIHGRSDYSFQSGEDAEDAECNAADVVIDDNVYALNGKIVNCVVNCLHLLAEEYLRVLQSRHWTQGDRPSGEHKVFVEYLVAIINDSYRQRSTHLASIRAVHFVDNGKKRELIHKVLHSFNIVEDRASQKLLRVIFSDIHAIILDFDAAWADYLKDNKSLSKEIITTMMFHFDYYKKIMHPVMYTKLLVKSMNVVVLRYLIFLIEKRNKSTKLSVEDLVSLQFDVKALKRCFNDLNLDLEDDEKPDTDLDDDSGGVADNPLLQGDVQGTKEKDIKEIGAKNKSIVEQQFDYLSDAVNLLVSTPGSLPFNSSLKNCLHRYLGGKLPAVSTAILETFVFCLNPASGTAEFNNIVHKLEIESSTLGRLLLSQRESLQMSVSSLKFTKLEAVKEEISNRYFISHASEYFGDNDLFKYLFLTNEKDEIIINRQAKAPNSSDPMQSPAGKIVTASDSVATPKKKGLGLFSSASSVSTQPKRKTEEYHANILRLLRLDEDSDESDNAHLSSARHRLDGDLGATGGSGSVRGGGGGGGGSVRDKSEMGASEDDDSTFGGTEIGDPPDCIVSVTALEVKGLKTAAIFSKCHPYVAVQLGAQRQKTATGAGNEFIWKDTTLTFETAKSRLHNLRLSVKVFDKELISRKRPLGGASVKLAGLALALGLEDPSLGRPIESWFALEGVPGAKGEIYLKVSVESKSA